MPLVITQGLGAGGGSVFPLGGVTQAAGGTITLTFPPGENPALTGASAVAANWAVSGPTAITVNSVSVVGQTVVLHTTHPYQAGGSYSLNIPVGIMDQNSEPFGGPFSVGFTGVSDNVTMLSAAAIDATTVRVLFDVAPDSSALNTANYSINNGLSVVSVSKQSSLIYLLKTSVQTAGVTYTVTISNIVAA